ncbi:MAG: sensor histidine kinase [Spirochaetia bacterium]
MRIQGKVFVSFLLLIIVSLVGSGVITTRLIAASRSVWVNQRIRDNLNSALDTIGESNISAEARVELIGETLAGINAEYTQYEVLEQDLYLNLTVQYLFLSALLLVFILLLSYAVSKGITKGLRNMVGSIQDLEDKGAAARISVPKERDLRILGDAVNHLLLVIQEKEEILKEQAKYVGWQEVASFLSHQIKNPLTSVMVAAKNISLLQEKGAAGNRAITESARILIEESQRLCRLVDRFKKMSAFPQPDLRQYSLSKVFNEISEEYGREAAEFVIEVPGDIQIDLDIQLFKEAIKNLIDNSIAAQDEKPVDVCISCNQVGDSCIIEYWDSIAVLDPGLPAKVMEPRFSTKPEGTGLGLPFVKKVISLHQGSVKPSLSSMGGLLFTIILPKRNI